MQSGLFGNTEKNEETWAVLKANTKVKNGCRLLDVNILCTVQAFFF